MRAQIMTLLNKQKEQLEIKNALESDNTRILNQYFPPFSSVVAIYNSKLRRYKNVILTLLFSIVVILSVEEYRINKALKSILNKEWLVIPGATSFMKVRPGEISDDTLFSFSDWVLKQLESFDYLDVDDQYHELEKYMAPEMRAKFVLEKKLKIEKYKKLAVVQYISFNKPNQIFQKVSDSGDPYYEVTYNGTIQRYSNDEKLKPITEVITIKFTTSSLENTNRKWFFNILDIQRQYSDASEAEEKLSSQSTQSSKG